MEEQIVDAGIGIFHILTTSHLTDDTSVEPLHMEFKISYPHSIAWSETVLLLILESFEYPIIIINILVNWSDDEWLGLTDQLPLS